MLLMLNVTPLIFKCLPVCNLMSNGDAQVKACVLCDDTVPVTGTSPA